MSLIYFFSSDGTKITLFLLSLTLSRKKIINNLMIRYVKPLITNTL